MFTFLYFFFYFWCCKTNVNSSDCAAVTTICPTWGKSALGNTDQMHEKCIFDVAGRERWMMGKSGLSGRWEGGMSGGSASSVLTWLWVSAPWRAALHSLLSSLSNNLSSLSFQLLSLYFPSSLTVFHLSLQVLLHSDFLQPTHKIIIIIKIRHRENWSWAAVLKKKKLENTGVMWLKDEEKGFE